MEIKDITKLMHEFVQSKGWYDSGSPKSQTARNLAISLSIEAAEVLEHFQWSDALENQEGFSDELADVTLYLFQLASVTGIDLESAVLRKLEINQKRLWNIK